MVKRSNLKAFMGTIILPVEGMMHLGLKNGGECSIECLDCGDITICRK